jgi:site-specific recombinase XerD
MVGFAQFIRERQLTLDGGGRKQRVVPFSSELRKALFRFITEYKRKPDALLLASRNETTLGRRGRETTLPAAWL